MKNDIIASYSLIEKEDNLRQLDEAQRICGIYKINVNLLRLANELASSLVIDEFNADWQITMGKALYDKIGSYMTKIQKDPRSTEKFREHLSKTIAPALSGYIHYKILYDQAKLLTVHDTDLLHRAGEKEKTLNKRVWKRTLDSGLTIILNFKTNNIFYNLIVQRSKIYPDLLIITYDIAINNGHGDQIKLRNLKFNHYPKIIMHPETGTCFICKDESHPDLPDDPLTEYPIQFNELATKFATKENKYMLGARAQFTDFTWEYLFMSRNNEDKLLIKQGFFGVSRGLISLQWVLKHYFDVIDHVTTVERTSTAEKRLADNTAAKKILAVDKTKEIPEERFISLSTLAIKKVREKKEWQGGHHESPYPHSVRTHTRTLKSGKVVVVKGYNKPCKNYKGDKVPKTVIIVDK